MVPDKLLGDANGLLSSLTQSIRIVAPLVGAGVFAAWGGNIVALADISTFVFSIGSYLALRITTDLTRPQRDPARERLAATSPGSCSPGSGTLSASRSSAAWCWRALSPSAAPG